MGDGRWAQGEDCGYEAVYFSVQDGCASAQRLEQGEQQSERGHDREGNRAWPMKRRRGKDHASEAR